MHHVLTTKTHHFFIGSHSVLAGMAKEFADMCPVLYKYEITIVVIR